ncbi:protein SOSEKI 1 [Magnolia sinica]|uniref:protein SOSEKI 1 n=1 Tax=Magnolia sinica TaxID=86752 RepID=UPI002657C4F4|nr:protein SOSEKI 1 [Magnolia sinica]
MESTDEMALMKEHLLKRRMEANGGEMRRIHVLYFLSRMGRIEHPHLIRVHNMNRTGVRLKDVKRWLSDLRGKDMPESFTWSFKRRYKTGYVWQDLLDEDLITPISDNEYVLKGSQISASAFDRCSCNNSITPTQIPDTAKDKAQQSQEDPDTKADISCQPAQIESEVGDSARRMVAFEVEEVDRTAESIADSSFPAFGSLREKKKSQRSMGRSYSIGASNVFRNLLACGVVETNESTIVPTNRRSAPVPREEEGSKDVCEVARLGGSRRFHSRSLNQQQQSSGENYEETDKSGRKGAEFGNQKKVPSIYKPVSEPNCSQCGKGFKPEKLHAHMKSCRGLKALGKGERPIGTSTDEMKPKEETLRYLLLTHTNS